MTLTSNLNRPCDVLRNKDFHTDPSFREIPQHAWKFMSKSHKWVIHLCFMLSLVAILLFSSTSCALFIDILENNFTVLKKNYNILLD